jgi:hypothetical protein
VPESSEPAIVHFSVQIARLRGSRPTEFETEEYDVDSPEEFDERLADFRAEPELVVGVTYVYDEGGEGSFWLFLNGDRGYIHLIDGPCYTARNPAFEGLTQGALTFRDDVGFPHEIELRNTVTRDQGLAALRHWMQGGEQLSELTWELEKTDADEPL